MTSGHSLALTDETPRTRRRSSLVLTARSPTIADMRRRSSALERLVDGLLCPTRG
jgi:hypothetical protein